jgi:hypothetical protein
MFGGCPGGGGITTLHKKEKLTTYYSIKNIKYSWKLAEAQLPKAPKNLGGLLEIEVYFSSI